MLLQFSQIFPFLYPTLLPVLPCSSIPPHLSSCPWVVHVSSLASLFPILFLTSPHLFYACQLCFLFTVPFPATFFPSPSPLKTLHVIPISLFCSCSICLLSFWVFLYFTVFLINLRVGSQD